MATGVRSLSRPDYPLRLAAAPGAPTSIYVRGELPETPRAVALVGARAARGHSVATARAMATELAEAGVLVVSGGAIGVDSAAHRGALDAGRPTVAVLAGGLTAPYPGRNRPLFDEIVAAGGGLLSMQAPGEQPLRPYFVARNAVIAMMVDAVVVIEAQVASGSLHTALAARKLGRVLAAAPGSPGCEALLAQGAAVAETAADVLAALDGTPRRPYAQLPEDGSREALALGALELAAPQTGAAIAVRSGLEPREAARALTGLELEGLALLVPGQMYLRSPLADQLMQR